MLSRRHGLRTVPLDGGHVSVRVGDELHDFVSHVRALPPQHRHRLVIVQDPGVLQHLLNLHTLRAIFDEQFGDEVFARLGDLRPDRVAERDLLVDGLAADLLVVLAVEWQMTAQHQIDDNTE